MAGVSVPVCMSANQRPDNLAGSHAYVCVQADTSLAEIAIITELQALHRLHALAE